MVSILHDDLQVVSKIWQKCTGTGKESGHQIQQTPTASTAFPIQSKEIYKLVITTLSRFNSNIHNHVARHFFVRLTNTVHMNSLDWVLGGLLDDLAVDLISEEFLLLPQLKQNKVTDLIVSLK